MEIRRIEPGDRAALERFLDGIPICVDSAIIPAGRCEPLIEESFEAASLFERLEVACGVVIDPSTRERS